MDFTSIYIPPAVVSIAPALLLIATVMILFSNLTYKTKVILCVLVGLLAAPLTGHSLFPSLMRRLFWTII